MTGKLLSLDKPHRQRVAQGLAWNSAAPLPVLRQIMHVPGVASTMATRRGLLPDDMADMLLALSDPDIAFFLDRDDRISPLIRERLANHANASVRDAKRSRAREWVAKGLHVPLDMLERLTGKAGPQARSELVSDPDPQVRCALAKAWYDAPDDVRRILLTDPEPSVRAAACRSSLSAPPPDLLPQLIGHPATRASAAKHIALTAELAAELAADGDEEVRSAVASNPHLPDSVRDGLAQSQEPVVWAYLICNRNTPEPLRASLHARLVEAAGQPDPSVDAEFASAILEHEPVRWLSDLPVNERLAYLDSPCAVFRRTLARHRDLPADAIAKLQRDADKEVRRIIARRPDAPGDYVERIVREYGENYKYRPLLVDHPNFPKVAFGTFAEEREPRLRRLACHDPQLPAVLVAQLSRDADAGVRQSAAGHPNLPTEDLLHLLHDENLEIVEAAAASPALPLDLMHRLADCVAAP